MKMNTYTENKDDVVLLVTEFGAVDFMGNIYELQNGDYVLIASATV